MWTLIAKWAAQNKAAVAAGVVAAALAAALAVQTIRLQASQVETAQVRVELQEWKVALREAEASAESRAAAVGDQVRQDYEQSIQADADAVGRAVARARAQCVPDAGAEDPAGVPDAPSVADGAPGDAAVNRDRAFGLAVAADLEVCGRELERMRALQEWVRGNSDAR